METKELIKQRIEEIVGHEITDEQAGKFSELMIATIERFTNELKDMSAMNAYPILKLLNPSAMAFFTVFNLFGNTLAGMPLCNVESK